MLDRRGIEGKLQAILDADAVDEHQARADEMDAKTGGGGRGKPPPLNYGGGGGTSSPMENRVTSLEIHMEYVQRDLALIATKLDTVISQTTDLPTKRDLSTFRWQWIATAAAAIAIIVGSIIGGLSWIKPDAAPASPIVVQMPAPVTAPIVSGDTTKRP